MKDWDYYSKPRSPYFGWEEEQTYKNALIRSIDDLPMTGADRTKALAKVKGQVITYLVEKNKPYNEERLALEAEFWADAREELGYDKILDKEGVSALEHEAYERGHSHGYSEIFCCLENLVSFVEKIVKHTKRETKK